MKLRKLIIAITNTDGMNAVSTKKLVAFAEKLEAAQHPQAARDFYNPEPEDDTDPPLTTPPVNQHHHHQA